MEVSDWPLADSRGVVVLAEGPSAARTDDPDCGLGREGAPGVCPMRTIPAPEAKRLMEQWYTQADVLMQRALASTDPEVGQALVHQRNQQLSDADDLQRLLDAPDAAPSAQEHAATCNLVTGKGMGLSENIIVTPTCSCKAAAPVVDLRAPLETLVNKLHAVHADPRYITVWAQYANHGGTYSGPSYKEELDAAQAALDAPTDGRT